MFNHMHSLMQIYIVFFSFSSQIIFPQLHLPFAYTEKMSLDFFLVLRSIWIRTYTYN